MKRDAYCTVSAVLFTVVALAHMARLLSGWPVEVGGAVIPMSVSWAGLIVPGALAVWGFRSASGTS